jgi:hypothetical protein
MPEHLSIHGCVSNLHCDGCLPGCGCLQMAQFARLEHSMIPTDSARPPGVIEPVNQVHMPLMCCGPMALQFSCSTAVQHCCLEYQIDGRQGRLSSTTPQMILQFRCIPQCDYNPCAYSLRLWSGCTA